MPTNPMSGHPAWRQLLVVVVALPAVVMAAVLAFAWPAARVQPRDLPVGIVGVTPAAQLAAEGLERAEPGGFDFHLYPTQDAARTAIGDRDVYGAFVVDDHGITVLEASAAGTSVAQLLTTAGTRLADAGRADLTVTDVVPTSAADPRGLVLGSSLLPLTICGTAAAVAIAVLFGFKPAWRQLVALVSVAAATGLGVELVAQGWLGALPHHHVETWAGLALMILAISSVTAGLFALIGSAGLALGAALMVFVGNSFSGVTSAPELLPDAVHHLGQWLPPGAGANLLRSTAYFDGHGAAGHLCVLLLWIAVGAGAIVVGHHTTPRFAAHPDHGTHRLDRVDARPAEEPVAAMTTHHRADHHHHLRTLTRRFVPLDPSLR